MAKAVAIPYVISLLLGIIVVAVIGYLLFLYFGIGSGQLNKQQCQGFFVSYCTQWAATGYSEAAKPNNQDFTGPTSDKNYPGCSSFSSQFVTTDKGACCKNVLTGKSCT